MQINVELMGVIAIAVGLIASYVRLQYRIEQLEKGHNDSGELQETRDKALWDKMNSFEESFRDFGKSLGRIEGTIEGMSHRQ
jgi:hypothetical protein